MAEHHQPIPKTVFISYRRIDIGWAQSIDSYLTKHGYDVFFDFRSIGAGDFEAIILSNILSRAHFLIILTPSALERCSNADDWVRREIETAIDHKRNVVPLVIEGFDFKSEVIASQLTGKLALLPKYNYVRFPNEYIEAAMDRLCTQFLNQAPEDIKHPTLQATKAATEQKTATKAAGRVFGTGSVPMYLVCGGFVLHPFIEEVIRSESRLEPRQALELSRYPLHKPDFGGGSLFSATNLIGISEARAWSYLLASFAPRRLLGIVDTDSRYRDDHDIDFLALGAYSNIRSKQVVKDGNNNLIVPAQFQLPSGEWDARFVTRDTGEPVHERADQRKDYALIMRVSPRDHPEHTWLICGGLGEWGTSGAAYFLANRWQMLADQLASADVRASSKHFAAIIEVERGSDSSARLVSFCSNRDQLRTFPVPEHTRISRFDED